MTGSFEITVDNSTEMECNENTRHCNAWRGRELLHCTVHSFGKVFKSIREQIQPVAGRGREAPGGGRGRGIKGESIDCFSHLMNRSRGNVMASL
jgi:hypothetical protein